MYKRFQIALLPLAILLSLGLSLAFRQTPPSIVVEPVKVTGWREGPVALLALGRNDSVFDLRSSLRCFLFEEEEKPLVWLGSYTLTGVKIYGEGKAVALVVREGGKGEAYTIRGLKGGAEVFIITEKGSYITVLPLLRIVEKGKLIEIRGEAKGASKVEAYAYSLPEDFNKSAPPLSSLFVTESQVTDGIYVIRLERGGAPFTQRNVPLLEINSTLVLYTDCSHAVLNLSEISPRVTVNLNCRG
ncbi:MAG: hypothetical protein N3E41_05165 [Thermofilaceae archaeon]|nr:hypothetical protein [Thermofilaceae archaeon]